MNEEGREREKERAGKGERRGAWGEMEAIVFWI